MTRPRKIRSGRPGKCFEANPVSRHLKPAKPVQSAASILSQLRKVTAKMTNQNSVSSLLARAEVLARQSGDDELASKILNLRLFGDGDTYTDIPAAQPADDVPPFDPPYTSEESGYRIPSGKYRGCLMRDLTTQQLQRVWSGFNGVQCDVADLLKAELRARMVVNR